MTYVAYRRQGDYLVAYRRDPIFVGGFTLMETKPVRGNSGVPGNAVLKRPQDIGLPVDPATGDIVITDAYHSTNRDTDGVLRITGVRVDGFVKVRTGRDVEIDTVRVRGGRPVGGLTRTALIDCNHPLVGSLGRENVVINRVDLVPSHPSEGIDGVVGHDFTLTRWYARDVVDYIGCFNSYFPDNPARVTIEGGFGEALLYLTPSEWHKDTDNRTHNDGIQIQGNSGYRIRGNNIVAFASATAGNGLDPNATPAPNPYAPSVTGQGLGITPNVSQVRDLLAEGGWWDGGAQSMTGIPGSKGAADIRILRNRFGRSQPTLTKGGVSAKRPVLLDPAVGAPGMPAATGVDLNNGNVYEDDGSPITVYRFVDGVSTSSGSPFPANFPMTLA